MVHGQRSLQNSKTNVTKYRSPRASTPRLTGTAMAYQRYASECHHGSMALHITGDTAADKLLSDDSFALLTGVLLDQQIS